MKSAALSIKQIASKLNSIFLKPGVDPMNFVSKLPHETLHSLFQDRRDGLVAYERGVLFSERLPLSPLWKKWIKCAFSVAYASNAIVERNERAFLSDKNQPVNKLNYDEISNLKLRLARLRVPTQTLNSRISYVKSSNDLSETLANMFIDTKEFTVASIFVHLRYPIQCSDRYQYGWRICAPRVVILKARLTKRNQNMLVATLCSHGESVKTTRT
jgi:hypothetical protein